MRLPKEMLSVVALASTWPSYFCAGFTISSPILITSEGSALRLSRTPSASNSFSNGKKSAVRIPFCELRLSNNSNDGKQGNGSPALKEKLDQKYLITSGLAFLSIAFLYWYLLVFGAAASANNLPVPSFIPTTPGWPPSDADLVPVIQDSIHFFYIKDILEFIQPQSSLISADDSSIPQLPQLRLAFFNFAEAWVFLFLPLMLQDRKRLPVPIVMGTWFGALGLTNAFLAPYFALRQLVQLNTDEHNKDDEDEQRSMNPFLGTSFGLAALLVVGYAFFQTVFTTLTAPGEWNNFLELVQTDRTYLAFAIDLFLFSMFQSFLTQEIGKDSGDLQDGAKIPFIGMLSLLLRLK